MCYSGRCLFEDHMGNCIVWNYKEFEHKYRYKCCQVGGSYEYDTPEYIEFYKQHEEKFKSIYRDYIKKYKILF